MKVTIEIDVPDRSHIDPEGLRAITSVETVLLQLLDNLRGVEDFGGHLTMYTYNLVGRRNGKLTVFESNFEGIE